MSTTYTPPAQTVILKMLDEFLGKASKINGSENFSKNPATFRKYVYKGLYILEFINGTDPDNSDSIFLNGTKISKDNLTVLLNLDYDSQLLLDKYQSNWVDVNLNKQIDKLKGNCD